jgi:membrane protease YdiL (CAAX protease family)
MNQEEKEMAADEPPQQNGIARQKKVGYGPLAAIFVSIGAFLCAQIIAGIVVFAFIFHGQGSGADSFQNSTVTTQFFTVLLVEAITIWVLWMFMRQRKVKWADIGLVKPKFRDAKYIAIGYVIYFALLIIATQLASKYIPGFDMDQEQELGFNKDTTGSSLGLIFVSLVILPPIVEEIVARGFLYTGLRTKLPFITAALITSALFGLAHLQGGVEGALIWAAALDTFLLSMILVTLREKTGSLWAPIGVHMLKNALAFSVLFIFKVN